MSDAPLIRLQNIKKYYQMGDMEVRALDGVTMEIRRGEYVAIMGPSGSGKSTMMNVIGCLDTPTSGTYELTGKLASAMSDDELAQIRNEEIGFVFQTFNLLARTTSIHNVELPLLYAGRHEAKRQAREALSKLGLGDRTKHEPNQLSGGQRQRVAVARALVTDPAILLADEPTGNLDSRTGQEILALFRSLNEGGRTIIIVTHDPAVANFCPRQIKLKDGKIVNGAAGPTPVGVPVLPPAGGAGAVGRDS